MGNDEKADRNNDGFIRRMMISEARNLIQIRHLTEQNGTTHQDEPTPLLKEVMAEDREYVFNLFSHLILTSMRIRSSTVPTPVE